MEQQRDSLIEMAQPTAVAIGSVHPTEIPRDSQIEMATSTAAGTESAHPTERMTDWTRAVLRVLAQYLAPPTVDSTVDSTPWELLVRIPLSERGRVTPLYLSREGSWRQKPACEIRPKDKTTTEASSSYPYDGKMRGKLPIDIPFEMSTEIFLLLSVIAWADILVERLS